MKKMQRTRLSQAVQGALLFAVLPFAAHAQEADSQAKTLDSIEVTGSRIKNAELAGQVPVQTITREQIERTGLTSIGDVIQEITGSGSSLNTRFNSSGNFGFPSDGSGVGAGATTVDLRHLGSKRVLVLVDGKRWINESSASGVGAATDLNTIPLAIVERIEVLEDGASALYGSDAIAGVVNIITRRNFSGTQISAYYGQYSEGDGDTTAADIAWGYNTDRANLFLSYSHTEQEEVFSSDRPISAIPLQGGSSRVPGGRFAFTDPNGRFYDLTTNPFLPNPTYTPGLPTCASGVARTDGFHCFAFANDAFNYAPFNLLVTPSERDSLFGQFRYQLTDNTSWYIKGLHNTRKSRNQAAPEPIDLGPGSGNFWSDNVIIPANHPFNPFGFRLDASNIRTIRRRPLEGGPRNFEQDVETSYWGTGVEGVVTFGTERDFFWDVNTSYSRNDATQRNFGSYNARRIHEALGNPATCAAIPGCVPLDIFGFGTITPAMLAWISPEFRDESAQTLRQYSANLSGDVFNLPAGAISFATGWEYRKYKGGYQPDPATVAGEYNGVPSLPTFGEYDVSEFYLEANVPLYNDSDSGSRLDFNLAGRYSDYSTFGGEFTPKYGLRWQVNDEFTMRATFAEGFRAPSIGELFGSQSRLDALLTDPCLRRPGGAPATGNPANCAALGVPVGATQIDPQISVLTGGNPGLDPERADSLTAGFVWSPSFATDASWSNKLDLELTYYRHEIEGAVQAVDPQVQLNLCVATLEPIYCDGITRIPSGQIDQFDNFLTNLGVIDTSGWDFDVFWTLPDTQYGQFKVSWQNTWVSEYEAIGAAGVVQPQGPGRVVSDTGIPEWTSNATLDWKHERWSAAWTLRYISSMTEDCLADNAALWCSNAAGGTNHLDATTYHDLQIGYALDWYEGINFTLGVNNLFDEEPPVCTSCSLNGYDPSNYDIPGGQFWYARFDVKF